MAQWAVKIYCLLSLWAQSTSGNSTNSSASHITGLPLPGLRWLIPPWGSDAGFQGGLGSAGVSNTQQGVGGEVMIPSEKSPLPHYI